MTTTSGALSHIKKAFEYIEHLSESDRSIYSCTKRTIAEMITTCEDIIEIGTCLIEECPTRSSDKHPKHSNAKPSNNPIVSDERLDKLEYRMDKMMELLDNVLIHNSVITNLKEDSSINNSSSNTSNSVDTDSKVSKPISEETKERKRAIGKYGEGFEYLQKVLTRRTPCPTPNLEIDDDLYNLGMSLCNWYKVRILNLETKKSPFRYSISNIITYIQSIICSYSDAMTTRSTQEWLHNFNHWIGQVRDNDPSVSSYALPYDIFLIYRDIAAGAIKLNTCSCFMMNRLWKAGLACVLSSDLKQIGCYGIYELLPYDSNQLEQEISEFESEYYRQSYQQLSEDFTESDEGADLL